jgi:hypothetical protein
MNSNLPYDSITNINVKNGYTVSDDTVFITTKNENGFWKYEEDKTLKEVTDYIQSTYNSHYTSKDSPTQVIDLIASIGDGEPFSRSNAIKYLSRFGRKNGKSKLDLLKAIHYCILLYYFSGLHSNKTDEYKTF